MKKTRTKYLRLAAVALIGAVLGYRLRGNRWLVPIPAVVSNTIIVPLILKYGYGIPMSLPLMALYICIGEIAGCYVLGEILAQILLKYGKGLFRQ